MMKQKTNKEIVTEYLTSIKTAVREDPYLRSQLKHKKKFRKDFINFINVSIESILSVPGNAYEKVTVTLQEPPYKKKTFPIFHVVYTGKDINNE